MLDFWIVIMERMERGQDGFQNFTLWTNHWIHYQQSMSTINKNS